MTGTRRDDILSTQAIDTKTLSRQADQDDRLNPSRLPHRSVTTAHGGARLTSIVSERRSASVLIVDRSDESRDVLRTVLEPRGVNILEAEQGAEGLTLLREQHPWVVVLDLEIDESNPAKLRDAFEDESRRNDTSLVMLGRVDGAIRSGEADHGPEGRHVIAKPYHYGPLIRTIEQLLQQHEAVA